MSAIPEVSPLQTPVSAVTMLAGTRFVATRTALDLPLYTSMIHDALVDNAVHKYNDLLRQNALHPVLLHAGQSAMPNGGIGRFAAPQLPELLGGDLVAINI